jgi:SAM-dependent methyltransferase
MSSTPGRIHDQAAVGFQRAAEAYERARPDYPQAAVRCLADALRIGPAARVVDLAAGTGKLTRLLVATGAQIVAVEPVEAMRVQLARLVPEAHVVDGVAERLPLADGAFDAVVVAQAFHWFATAAALAEIHRVLKPGGGLGLIWNVRDESVGWVRRIGEILRPYQERAPHYSSMEWRAAFQRDRLFSPLQTARFAHVYSGSLDGTIDRVRSVSFIAALDGSEREAILAQVRELLQSDPQTQGRRTIEFPYRTVVYWCKRR